MMQLFKELIRTFPRFSYTILPLWFLTAPSLLLASGSLDDLTAGFVHLNPPSVNTTNGCTDFTVDVLATVTDARAFSLHLVFNSDNLELLTVTPAADSTLHLMPEAVVADSIWLDGFFHPNRTGPSVPIAHLAFQAITPGDASGLIGFFDGQGYGGFPELTDTILFAGDSCQISIEGTAPRPPDSVIIQTLPNPATDDSILISWPPVTLDLDNDPVTNPLYTIYMRDVLNDTMYFVTGTHDTFLYHDYITFSFGWQDSVPPLDTTIVVNVGVYEVHTCKTQP